MTNPELTNTSNNEVGHNEPTIDKLARLMGEIGVDPELDSDPSERNYVIAFPIMRPGMKVEKRAILTLEEAAMYCEEHIAEYGNDDGLKVLIERLLTLGNEEIEFGREELARKIGRSLMHTKFPDSERAQ